MKVEFWSSQEHGAELLIPASEFVKAKKSAEEFQSLACASEAFSAILGFDYSISEREYELVTKKLDKGGTVILFFAEEGGAVLEISDSNHHVERITVDGRLAAHLNPKTIDKAIDKIKARYEKEAKRK